jgi:hypothetical protein
MSTQSKSSKSASHRTTSIKRSISETHAMAPISAEFVKQMREVFGEVHVLMVSEGELHFDKRK